MHHEKNKQSGFAHIGVVIAVVAAIVVVGFGGWWVWQKNQVKPTTDNKSALPADNKPENNANTGKSFNCNGVFSIIYPDSWQATITDAEQCLISNVGVEEMPSVGPVLPEQVGLFFSTQATGIATNSGYLNDYIKRSQEDNALELKSQEEIKLDNGATAILARIYGGHPTKHDFYFFIHIKNGTAITTSYPVNSNYKEEIFKILKSIE